jgi:thiol-disulfide isomerase/thioredoxin
VIEAFSLGPLLIPTRPLILVLCLLFAIWLSGWLATRYQIDKSQAKAGVEYIAWFALLGARLGFVIFNWSAYQAKPWTALYLWQPGYLYQTGLLFGAGYLSWYIYNCTAQLRKPLLRLLIGSYIAAGVLFTSTIFSIDLLRQPGIPGIGDQAPDFRLQNLSGETVTLSSLAGRAVILNFWATWCPPCRREMPLLDEIQNKYHSKGLTVIGLDIDEPLGLVRSYIKSVNVSYPIWVDAPLGMPGYDRTQTIFSRFGGIGYPSTIFIDRAGIIQNIYVGELSQGFLQSQAENILGK